MNTGRETSERTKEIFIPKGIVTPAKPNKKTGGEKPGYNLYKWLLNRLIALGLINADPCCGDYVAGARTASSITESVTDAGVSIEGVDFEDNVISDVRNNVIAANDIDVAGAITLTTAQSGSTILIDAVGGYTITLPAAATGLTYRFVNTVTLTSSTTITAAAADLLIGAMTMVDTDTSDTHTDQVPDVVDDLIITLNGTTTGGLIGSDFTLTAISASRWWVSGTQRHSSNVATPFS